MGSLLNEYFSLTQKEEQPDAPESNDKDDTVAEGKDDSMDKEVTDKDTIHEPGNGEHASSSPDSSIQEPENQVQKSCASEDAGLPLPQFKNVVAIVDPPRGGLHPIVSNNFIYNLLM